MEHTIDHAGNVDNMPPPAPVAELKPISVSERIQAIDVVRGFALIGIFFMNVEWFNRSFLDFGLGIPADAKGLDWLAYYFVNFFVAGKFWTIFSLLFGMGFAVMLTRSEETGRAFIKPYIRRIVALAAFGILHINLLWPGDILYSYAFTAAGLLIVLFGKWQWIIASIIVFFGLAAVPGLDVVGILGGAIIMMGVAALYLRNEKIVSFLGLKMPLFSALCLTIALIAAMVSVASQFVPTMNEAFRPAAAISGAFLLTSWLSAKFHQPVEARLWRAGVWLYLAPLLVGLVFSLFALQKPLRSVFDSPAAVQLADKKAAEKKLEEAQEKLAKASGKPVPKKEEKPDDKKAKVVKTEAQKELESDADAINRIRDGKLENDKEVAVFTKGSYVDMVKLRFKNFSEGPFNEAGQAFVSIGLFLLGVWFVRSKVIVKAKENLALFRRIAYVCLPLGLGLSIAASFIAVSHVRGVQGDGWQLAQTLIRLGSLPACLAYVSVVVLMVHSNSIFSKISVLAPMGRMALTNYLMQSVIQASFFYGWGLGYFGLGRAQQLGFAVLVLVLQCIFSHWWLARFRYGPMEWVWRGITYWKIPELRIESKQLNPQLA